MKTALLTLVLAGSLASAATQDPVKKDPVKQDPTSAPKEIVIVKSANIKWEDHPSVEGAKTAVQSGDPAKGPVVVLIKFPKGSTVPPHWHTATETVTVVSGKSVFGSGETVDEAKGTELGSGSFIVIPSKSPHWAIIKEELVISVAMDKAADFHLCSEKK